MLMGARFRLETLDDSLQPTIDMLLNVSIFMWYVSYSGAGRMWLTMAGTVRSAPGPALFTTRWFPSIVSSESASWCSSCGGSPSSWRSTR